MFELPAFPILICQTAGLPGRLTVSMLPPDASRAYWTLVRCAIGLFFHPPDAVLDQSPICAIRERHAR